jgi:hypothetical protein
MSKYHPLNEDAVALPWPWEPIRHVVFGDWFLFCGASWRSFAIGGEAIQAGLVIFLGPFLVGIASMSAYAARAKETNHG